jgi:hypothetical protein
MCSPNVTETCRVLRLLLWSVRGAIAAQRGDDEAAGYLVEGLALMGMSGTALALRDFAASLATVDWPLAAWHSPRCCCMSTQEAMVLRALGNAAGRDADVGVWRSLVPPPSAALVDQAARRWLADLAVAGVSMPAPADLEQSLVPVEWLASSAGSLH